MAHMAKHTRAAVGHLCSHFDRQTENISNPNIDPQRTPENYNLGPDRDVSQGDFIRERCGEVRMLNRKDVNVMCTWVVTAPKDLPQIDQQQFFQSSYDFMADRYGGEKNVVSAYVHMDEVTPHMHFAFVPVVDDQKRGDEKVSAHEAVNRRDLQTFHTDLSRHMEQTFGREIGVLNEATRDGNRSIEELKRGAAAEIIQDAQGQAADIVRQSHAEGAKITLEGQARVEALERQERALQGKIEGLGAMLEQTTSSWAAVDALKPQKSLGGVKGVTVEDVEGLKAAAKAYHVLAGEHQRLQQGYAEIKKQVPSMKEKMQQSQELARLKNIERAFSRLPPEVQEQIMRSDQPHRGQGQDR